VKLAFVSPRFGAGVLGGSEAVLAEAASGFASRGHEVEVLTTTAVDHYSWANERPEGASVESGLLVRRFGVARHPSRAALAAQLSVQAGRVPDIEHQVSWLGFHFSCPGLFEHLARCGTGYDAVVFAPYLFWSTTACLPLVADRAVFMPCLHDEAYARLDLVRPLLAAPALAWFLSAPEHWLAHRLGPVAGRHSVVGAGVVVPSGYDPAGFRARHGLSRPFLLYAGRREAGKGLSWLLRALAASGADIDLVVIGKGEPGSFVDVPPALAGRVFDLGFVEDSERDDAFAAALAYVQPSRVESFSRTVMESWLAGTPVLGLASNEVVAWHCRRSGGGLLFSDPASLASAVARLQGDGGLAGELGRAGRRYVVENYTWPVVLDRMEASLLACPGLPPRGGALRPEGGQAQTERDLAAEAAAGGKGATSGPGRPVRSDDAGPPSPPRARWLVAGSYPPVPGAPAAATFAAVRRLWASGSEAVVASPRPSAARYVLTMTSPISLAFELAALARRERCAGLVLSVQPGWPVPARFRLGGRLAMAALGYLLRRYFSERQVVVTGPVDLACVGPLLRQAQQVTASSPEVARAIAERFAGLAVSLADVSAGAASAGPLEPGELLVVTRARRALGRLARLVLGRHYPALRSWVSRLSGRRSLVGL